MWVRGGLPWAGPRPGDVGASESISSDPVRPHRRDALLLTLRHRRGKTQGPGGGLRGRGGEGSGRGDPGRGGASAWAGLNIQPAPRGSLTAGRPELRTRRGAPRPPVRAARPAPLPVSAAAPAAAGGCAPGSCGVPSPRPLPGRAPARSPAGAGPGGAEPLNPREGRPPRARLAGDPGAPPGALLAPRLLPDFSFPRRPLPGAPASPP